MVWMVVSGSRCVTRPAQSVGHGLWPYLKAQQGEDHSCDSQKDSVSFWLSETSVPCHVDLSITQFAAHSMAAGFLQSEQGRERERENAARVSKAEVILCHLILEGKSHRFSHILLLRSRSHSRGRGLCKSLNTGRRGWPGAFSEASYHKDHTLKHTFMQSSILFKIWEETGLSYLSDTCRLKYAKQNAIY